VRLALAVPPRRGTHLPRFAGTIEEALSLDKHLGPVDLSTVEKVVVEEAKAPVDGEVPTLGGCLNLLDIEVRRLRSRNREEAALLNSSSVTQRAAEAVLKPKAFGVSVFRVRLQAVRS
jgi:hypothetical protein